jgi:hypothetical protein
MNDTLVYVEHNVDMDPGIIITLEYIFDEYECDHYLNIINIDSQRYEQYCCWYKPYKIVMKLNEHHDKKKVRKLKNVQTMDLSEYPNVFAITIRKQMIHIKQFPKQLTYINIQCDLHDVCPMFHEGIKQLHFQQLPESPDLPETLTHLTVGKRYDKRIEYPPGLKYLTWCCSDKYLRRLPRGLIGLKIQSTCGFGLPQLSDELKYLSLGINGEREFYFQCLAPKLPISLTQLIINSCAQDVDILPNNLIHLTWNCNQIIPDFPPALIYLTLGHLFKQKIKRLPKQLIQLTWNCEQDIPKLIFNNSKLVILEIGTETNAKIPKLPNTITRIMIHCDYKYLKDVRRQYGNKVTVH